MHRHPRLAHPCRGGKDSQLARAPVRLSSSHATCTSLSRTHCSYFTQIIQGASATGIVLHPDPITPGHCAGKGEARSTTTTCSSQISLFWPVSRKMHSFVHSVWISVISWCRCCLEFWDAAGSLGSRLLKRCTGLILVLCQGRGDFIKSWQRYTKTHRHTKLKPFTLLDPALNTLPPFSLLEKADPLVTLGLHTGCSFSLLLLLPTLNLPPQPAVLGLAVFTPKSISWVGTIPAAPSCYVTAPYSSPSKHWPRL